MKRRDFLKKAGVGTAAAVAATTLNAPAVIAQKKYRWKMVTTWTPGLPVLLEGCKRLANKVKEMSEGRLQIQVFGFLRTWTAAGGDTFAATLSPAHKAAVTDIGLLAQGMIIQLF